MWVHIAKKEDLPQENLTCKAQIQLMLPKEQLKVDLKTWSMEKPNEMTSQLFVFDAVSYVENTKIQQYEADR